MFILTCKIFPSLVTDEEIKFFLSYYDYNFEEIDSTLSPRISGFSLSELEKSKWYKPIQSILNKVLDEPFTIDGFAFFEVKNHYGIHVDTGYGNLSTLYKNILIPLEWQKGAATVVFENKWYGKRTTFTKSDEISTLYFHNRIDKDDFLNIREKGTVHPHLINQTHNISREKYYEMEKVQSVSATPISYVENYDADLKFDKEIHKKYFKKQNIDQYDGLTVQQIFDWTKGSVFTFDRQYVHTGAQAGDSLNSKRRGITIFTNRKI